MEINADEISKVISRQIKDYEDLLELEKKGIVISVGDGIAHIYGLREAMASEMIRFPGDLYGIVLNLEETVAGVILLGDYSHINEGDEVYSTGNILQIPVGDEIIGRVVNPIGIPLDGGKEIKTDKFRPLEGTVPNVVQRQPVKEPLQTGLKAIDSMIPIGRGQRELILGNRSIGKTAICIDTIINQKDSDVICIYVAIGQKNSTVARTVKTLEEYGAMEYTTVVNAGSSDPAALQYIAPYAGASIAEEIMHNGGHALVIYDDLSKHAWAYRQLSLLLRRPPGREAYPGDVFYLHSRLLERAAKLSDELGGGSMTALPIIETQAGDITAYIPTNVISITDGQIYVEDELFYSGIRPAINAGLSVSRVGGNAQLPAMRKVAGGLRLELAQYRELEKFVQFGTELDETTRQQLRRGEVLIEILKQDQYSPMDLWDQVFIIYAGIKGHLDDMPLESIDEFEKTFLEYIDKEHPEFRSSIMEDGRLTDKEYEKLDDEILNYKKRFLGKDIEG
jgi:F-type H+-transporting ATPase subunit alpha